MKDIVDSLLELLRQEGLDVRFYDSCFDNIVFRISSNETCCFYIDNGLLIDRLGRIKIDIADPNMVERMKIFINNLIEEECAL